MIDSVQVTFRNMTAIEDVRKEVEARVQKLETYCKPILSCRVVIEAPAKHHRHGDPFHVRIDTTLTDGRVVVKYAESLYPKGRDRGAEPTPNGLDATSEHNCLMLTIRETFDAARRQLQEHARRRRFEVKRHERARGVIVRGLPEEEFG